MAELVYDRGGIQLWCGDCRDVLPGLADGSVDLVLTDPPYGVGKAKWDNLPHGALRQSWLKTRGAMLSFWSAFDLGRVPREVGEAPKNTIVWWKPNLPALWMWDRSRLASQWEPIFYFARDGYEPCRRITDVIAWNYPPNGGARYHPTQKPIGLVSYLLHGFGGDLVLDPFVGSGTTLVAAKQLGRRAIGVELSPAYCEIAIRRLAQEVMPLHEEPRPASIQSRLLEDG